jgi:hypothetical protein
VKAIKLKCLDRPLLRSVSRSAASGPSVAAPKAHREMDEDAVTDGQLRKKECRPVVASSEAWPAGARPS